MADDLLTYLCRTLMRVKYKTRWRSSDVSESIVDWNIFVRFYVNRVGKIIIAQKENCFPCSKHVSDVRIIHVKVDELPFPLEQCITQMIHCLTC